MILSQRRVHVDFPAMVTYCLIADRAPKANFFGVTQLACLRDWKGKVEHKSKITCLKAALFYLFEINEKFC